MSVSRWFRAGAAVGLLAFVACGSPDDAASDDADADDPQGDAGPPPATRQLAGTWVWSATAPGSDMPAMTCKVAIGDTGFEIRCPVGTGIEQVATSCDRVAYDLHIAGEVGDRLDAMMDHVAEYQDQAGATGACAKAGFTVGIAVPEPGFAEMAAERSLPMSLDGFLERLGGRWAYELRDTRSNDPPLACAIEVALSAAPIGVRVAIDCAVGAAHDVLPGCAQTPHLRLDALVTAALAPGAAELRATGLTGQIVDVAVHEGESCGTLFPPEVKSTRFIMTAEPATGAGTPKP